MINYVDNARDNKIYSFIAKFMVSFNKLFFARRLTRVMLCLTALQTQGVQSIDRSPIFAVHL